MRDCVRCLPKTAPGTISTAPRITSPGSSFVWNAATPPRPSATETFALPLRRSSLTSSSRCGGKCHPTDCYWGEVEGVAQTGSNAGWYTFHYDQGFADRYVWVR